MSPLTGSGWQDATAGTYPDWLQVEFDGSKTIDEIDVFTAQDAYWDPVEPTESMTCSTYNITNFDVQYWNGSSWVTVPGGSVTGNNKVWRKFTFTAVTTTKIRVVCRLMLDQLTLLAARSAMQISTVPIAPRTSSQAFVIVSPSLSENYAIFFRR